MGVQYVDTNFGVTGLTGKEFWFKDSSLFFIENKEKTSIPENQSYVHKAVL